MSDGSIQVYVCVEMEKAKEEVLNELSNQLDQDGVIAIKADRERFINQISEGLDQYKKDIKSQYK